MKFDRQKSFSYPVLRPHSDDYPDSEFQATIDFVLQDTDVSARIEYALSSESIATQIAEGRAKYLTVFSCRETYYRTTVLSSDQMSEINFERGALRGEVRVEPYIVAVKRIEGYTSDELNDEYQGIEFHLIPGHLLAQEETQVFYFDHELFKPVSSVFDLVKNDNLSSGEWLVDLDSDHVQIQVSPGMKESIDNARNSKVNKVVLINSLYFSAVAHAAQRLKDSAGAYEGYQWARVMTQIAHNGGWEIESIDAYVLAQRMMKNPFRLLDAYVFAKGE